MCIRDSSQRLTSMVELYSHSPRSLQTYDCLIGMLEQWLDRNRITQLTLLERATEDERRRTGALTGIGVAGCPLPSP
eukprot:13694879-Alexandrium_andersonii.AAC.1